MNYHEIKIDISDITDINSDVKLKQFNYGNDIFRVSFYKSGEFFDPTQDFDLCNVRTLRSDGRVNEREIWKKDDENLSGIKSGDDGVYYADIDYGLFESFKAGSVGFEIIFYALDDAGIICKRHCLPKVNFEVYKSISSYNIVDQKSIDIISHILSEVLSLKTTANAQEYIDMLEAAKSAEQKRIISENDRVASESARKSEEIIRISSEEERNISENERKNNEILRIDAENERNLFFEEVVANEDIRQSSEKNRADSETVRENNESSRILAENERISAEILRESAEAERKNAEDSRIEYINQTIAQKISEIVNSAPETLDTLSELAKALGNDPNFATTIATIIGKNQDHINGLAYYGDPNIKPTDASYFTFTLDDATMTASVGYNGDKGYVGDVVIPHHYTEDDKTYTVTSIAESGFFNYANQITSVIIPNTVTAIGDYAFSCSEGIKKISIPDSVETIGTSALDYLQQLTEITLPKNLKTIGNFAFSDCSKLKDIIIPDGVTSIGDCVFSYCLGLENVVIPVSVESIGTDLFYEDTFYSTNEITVYYNGTQEQWEELVGDKDVFSDDVATLVCLGAATKEYVDTKIGDIETALDHILVLDNELLGVSE